VDRDRKKDMKKEITVLPLCAMLLALCSPAAAQQPKKVYRIGYLSQFDPASESTRAEAIRLALRELGYIEGQNIAIEYRYGEGKTDRYPELLADLVRLKVDIILASAGTTIRLAKNATKTIPIVMAGLPADPVELGLVESLARPGGNVTGVTSLSRELAGKRLELFKEASQTCPCRGSLRTGHSEQCTRGERGSPSRGACARVDYSALGDTRCGRFRQGIRCAE
jgi:ABC-type uncharacterized transport system substrate-binding protein